MRSAARLVTRLVTTTRSYTKFALTWWQRIFVHVSQKEIVLDAISELPDEVSLQEIAEKIEFLAAIQKGMDQLDRGEGIPHEEVKRQLATWLAS